MSGRNRSRSPHVSRTRSGRTTPSSDNPNLSPKSTALWRQRRVAAEKDDYDQRRLSPARLSPYRSFSPARPKSESKPPEKLTWDEEEDENDIYLDRAERALAGLENYQQQFKQYTPQANKENVSPSNNLPSTSPSPSPQFSNGKNSSNNNRPRSRHSSGGYQPSHANRLPPKPVAIEADPDVLIRRQKDIDYGKNQSVYAEYLQNVEKEDRSDMQPWTPDKYEKMTRRNWDKQVKIWRKQLHYWKEPKSVTELLTPGTSPCPSPHRRASPPRFLNPNCTPTSNNLFQKTELSKALFGGTVKSEVDDDNAMTGFPDSSGDKKFLSDHAKMNLKTDELMEDGNSNSCMSTTEDGVPMAFRR